MWKNPQAKGYIKPLDSKFLYFVMLSESVTSMHTAKLSMRTLFCKDKPYKFQDFALWLCEKG